MNIKFDKETDTVYVRFSDSEIVESDEEKPGVIIDYDKDGEIAGIELLDASGHNLLIPIVVIAGLDRNLNRAMILACNEGSIL